MKKLEKIIAFNLDYTLELPGELSKKKKKKKHPKPERNNHFSPSKKSLRMLSRFEFSF